MSQHHKNGQTTQTSNGKTARLLWVNVEDCAVQQFNSIQFIWWQYTDARNKQVKYINYLYNICE